MCSYRLDRGGEKGDGCYRDRHAVEHNGEPDYHGSVKTRKKFPLHPKHPERICWGCDKYCPADSLMCGNGSGRTEHPAEMMGEDWYTWGLDSEADAEKPTDTPY
jgi:hypothetical protein